MKILIVTRSFVREVNELVKYVVHHSEQPWKFHLVFPHDAQFEGNLPASVSIRRMYFPRKIRTACYGPSLLLDFLKFQPDIVQVFEEFSGLLAFQSFLLRALLARNSKSMVYSAENIVGNVRSALKAPMKYVMKRANLAFVCSHGVKKVLRQEGAPAPIEVFPLGVDTEKFYKFSVDHFKQQLKLDGKFVIGYVGRLYQFKGVFLLIELMRKLPEYAHLLVIGSGPEEHALRQRAESYNLDYRIHFYGAVSYKELPDYINCMDVGIVPSLTTKRWKEQFGRTLIELMSCEVPVIASTSGSIPEVMGDAGHLVDEANVQQLYSSVHALMASPEKSFLLGRKGRERVRSLYSIEVMGERFLTMYHSLMLRQGNTEQKK